MRQSVLAGPVPEIATSSLKRAEPQVVGNEFQMNASRSGQVHTKRGRVFQEPAQPPNDICPLMAASTFARTSSSARHVPTKPIVPQKRPGPTYGADSDTDFEPSIKRKTYIDYLNEKIETASKPESRVQDVRQQDRRIPIVPVSSPATSDEDTDSTSHLGSKPSPARSKAFTSPHLLPTKAAGRFDLHGPEQDGFREGGGWRTTDTPVRDDD
jgi:hypothetical protein